MGSTFAGMRWVWFAAAAGALVWAVSGIRLIIIPVDEPEESKASHSEDDERPHEVEDEEDEEVDVQPETKSEAILATGAQQENQAPPATVNSQSAAEQRGPRTRSRKA